MKDRLKAKLKSKAGETIGETLIALLVSALALTMLAGAISTAAKLITESETKMTEYYAGINALGNPNTSGLSVELIGAEESIKLMGNASTIDVSYSINPAFPNKPVIAYKKAT